MHAVALQQFGVPTFVKRDGTQSISIQLLDEKLRRGLRGGHSGCRLGLELGATPMGLAHRSRNPIRAVLAVGHADRALRKSASERAAFELDVSQRRANSARRFLLDELIRLAGDSSGEYLVYCRAIGLGSSDLKIYNPVNESQMKKNRRVEFRLMRETVGEPNCNCGS